jgi:hypothetical protein
LISLPCCLSDVFTFPDNSSGNLGTNSHKSLHCSFIKMINNQVVYHPNILKQIFHPVLKSYTF